MTHYGRAVLVVVVLACIGCSKRQEIQIVQAKSDPQLLPFEQTVKKTGKSPTAALSTSSIPTGLPITVRLDESLSSMIANRGEVFTASLDQPIVLGGQVLAPAGSPVIGQVLSAKAADSSSSPGYLRLTLTRIVVNGNALALKTSSLFEKGGVVKNRQNTRSAARLLAVSHSETHSRQIQNDRDEGLVTERDAHLLPEQRLTFRIASVVPLA